MKNCVADLALLDQASRPGTVSSRLRTLSGRFDLMGRPTKVAATIAVNLAT